MKIIQTLLVAIMLASCGQGDDLNLPGVDGPRFHVSNGMVIADLKLENLNFNVQTEFTIPKLENSFIAVNGSADAGTDISLHFDPQDVISTDFDLVDPNTLPDGRAFPLLPDGTLPSIAINIPSMKNTTFYASKEVVGFFIPYTHGIGIDMAQRIVVNGKDVGFAALVRADSNGENSGFLIILEIDNLKNRRLQKLIKRSLKSRNMNKIY